MSIVTTYREYLVAKMSTVNTRKNKQISTSSDDDYDQLVPSSKKVKIDEVSESSSEGLESTSQDDRLNRMAAAMKVIIEVKSTNKYFL